MSPWGRFILRYAGLTANGLFTGAPVVRAAVKQWGFRAVESWHHVLVMSK